MLRLRSPMITVDVSLDCPLAVTFVGGRVRHFRPRRIGRPSRHVGIHLYEKRSASLEVALSIFGVIDGSLVRSRLGSWRIGHPPKQEGIKGKKKQNESRKDFLVEKRVDEAERTLRVDLRIASLHEHISPKAKKEGGMIPEPQPNVNFLFVRWYDLTGLAKSFMG